VQKPTEARTEADELRRSVKQLEEQRNKGLVEADSGKLFLQNLPKNW
jgi:hypothetical protein